MVCECIFLQAYYLAAPFAVERAPTKALLGYPRRKDVEVALLSDYPVKGLVFEAGESLNATARLVGAACRRLQVLPWAKKTLASDNIGLAMPSSICCPRASQLHILCVRSQNLSWPLCQYLVRDCLTSWYCAQDANIPHNILVVDCGQRLFLFPNNYSLAKAAGSVPDDLLDTQVDPAAFEIAGHLILKRSEDYQSISQVISDKRLVIISVDSSLFAECALYNWLTLTNVQAWIWRLLSYACLPDKAFQTFLDLALND